MSASPQHPASPWRPAVAQASVYCVVEESRCEAAGWPWRLAPTQLGLVHHLGKGRKWTGFSQRPAGVCKVKSEPSSCCHGSRSPQGESRGGRNIGAGHEPQVSEVLLKEDVWVPMWHRTYGSWRYSWVAGETLREGKSIPREGTASAKALRQFLGNICFSNKGDGCIWHSQFPSPAMNAEAMPKRASVISWPRGKSHGT